MANINAAFGLRPYRMLGSGANTNGDSVYNIQTAATAGSSSFIYFGQPVIPLSNGMIGPVASATGGTTPLLGVFLGCNYVDLTGKPRWSPYWPKTAAAYASSPATAIVAAHPDQAFLIACDAAAADTLVHTNADFAALTSGSTVTGTSAGTLGVSTATTTNTLNLRILGFEDTPANSDAASAGRLAIVLLNNHFYRYNANGTGAGI